MKNVNQLNDRKLFLMKGQTLEKHQKQSLKDDQSNSNKSLEIDIKTKLIFLTQNSKYVQFLNKISRLSLSTVKKALQIDYKVLYDSISKEQKQGMNKFNKQQKSHFMYQVAEDKYQQASFKDYKNSFGCWYSAQVVAYMAMVASRGENLNGSERNSWLGQCEKVLSLSSIGSEFQNEDRYQLMQLCMILEKMHIWCEMGDYIKVIELFNEQESQIQRAALKYVSQDFQFNYEQMCILLYGSRIYCLYSLIMVKIKDIKQSLIDKMELYIQITGWILSSDEESFYLLFSNQDQQSALVNLFILLFYKYIQSLHKDNQQEKAFTNMQSFYQTIDFLNHKQLLKNDDKNQKIMNKLQLLSLKIKSSLVSMIGKEVNQDHQNELLETQHFNLLNSISPLSQILNKTAISQVESHYQQKQHSSIESSCEFLKECVPLQQKQQFLSSLRDSQKECVPLYSKAQLQSSQKDFQQKEVLKSQKTAPHFQFPRQEQQQRQDIPFVKEPKLSISQSKREEYLISSSRTQTNDINLQPNAFYYAKSFKPKKNTTILDNCIQSKLSILTAKQSQHLNTPLTTGCASTRTSRINSLQNSTLYTQPDSGRNSIQTSRINEKKQILTAITNQNEDEFKEDQIKQLSREGGIKKGLKNYLQLDSQYVASQNYHSSRKYYPLSSSLQRKNESKESTIQNQPLSQLSESNFQEQINYSNPNSKRKAHSHEGISRIRTSYKSSNRLKSQGVESKTQRINSICDYSNKLNARPLYIADTDYSIDNILIKTQREQVEDDPLLNMPFVRGVVIQQAEQEKRLLLAKKYLQNARVKQLLRNSGVREQKQQLDTTIGNYEYLAYVTTPKQSQQLQSYQKWQDRIVIIDLQDRINEVKAELKRVKIIKPKISDHDENNTLEKQDETTDKKQENSELNESNHCGWKNKIVERFLIKHQQTLDEVNDKDLFVEKELNFNIRKTFTPHFSQSCSQHVLSQFAKYADQNQVMNAIAQQDIIISTVQSQSQIMEEEEDEEMVQDDKLKDKIYPLKDSFNNLPQEESGKDNEDNCGDEYFMKQKLIEVPPQQQLEYIPSRLSIFKNDAKQKVQNGEQFRRLSVQLDISKRLNSPYETKRLSFGDSLSFQMSQDSIGMNRKRKISNSNGVEADLMKPETSPRELIKLKEKTEMEERMSYYKVEDSNHQRKSFKIIQSNKKGDHLLTVTQQNIKPVIQTKFSAFKDYLEDDTHLKQLPQGSNTFRVITKKKMSLPFLKIKQQRRGKTDHNNEEDSSSESSPTESPILKRLLALKFNNESPSKLQEQFKVDAVDHKEQIQLISPLTLFKATNQRRCSLSQFVGNSSKLQQQSSDQQTSNTNKRGSLFKMKKVEYVQFEQLPKLNGNPSTVMRALFTIQKYIIKKVLQIRHNKQSTSKQEEDTHKIDLSQQPMLPIDELHNQQTPLSFKGTRISSKSTPSNTQEGTTPMNIIKATTPANKKIKVITPQNYINKGQRLSQSPSGKKLMPISKLFSGFEENDKFLKLLLSVKHFRQKVRDSISGLVNNRSSYHNKLYPPFKFTRLIQGVPILWKVKHQCKMQQVDTMLIQNNYLTIFYGNSKFSILIDLEYAGEQLKGYQFSTLWPLYLVGFEKYLKDQNIRIQVTKKQTEVKKGNVSLSFLEGMSSKVTITEFDLSCVGNLKDLLDLFLRHFFEFQRKPIGLVLEYKKGQSFPSWKLIAVKKAQKQLDRFISYSQENKIQYCDDFKGQRIKYEQCLQQNQVLLQRNLQKFMQENHLLGVFIKKSTGGYYYILTVKVCFRASNDISTQIVNGQLMLSDFSFYITGRNLGTFQTILPLEIHASQVAKYFPANSLVREINKFFLRLRLSNRWTILLINFFKMNLCLTLPKQSVATGKNKVQKLIFRDNIEIRRRIMKECQKQVILSNPFNDFFLLEQMKQHNNGPYENQDHSDRIKGEYDNIVNDNFNDIIKKFYKNSREEQLLAAEKTSYFPLEDDELDKKYEYQTYKSNKNKSKNSNDLDISLEEYYSPQQNVNKEQQKKNNKASMKKNKMITKFLIKNTTSQQLKQKLQQTQFWNYYNDTNVSVKKSQLHSATNYYEFIKQGNQLRAQQNQQNVNVVDKEGIEKNQLKQFWQITKTFGEGKKVKYELKKVIQNNQQITQTLN